MFDLVLTILKRKKYLVIALLMSFIMSAISYYLTVMNVYKKSLIIYGWMNGWWFTIASVSLSAIIAILFGVYIGLLFFKRDLGKIKAKGKAASGLATVGGIVASGCPSCGVPLLGVVGFPLALFSLPLKGIEIKLLSIGLLVWSVMLVIKSINKNLQCENRLS